MCLLGDPYPGGSVPVFRTATRVAMIMALIGPAAAMAQDPAVTTPTDTPPAAVMAAGVSVAGTDVSGLSATDARAKILSGVVLPQRQALAVTFRGRNLQIDPDAVGAARALGSDPAGLTPWQAA